MKQRVFISNAIDEEKLPFISAEEMKFGRAHYSWKIIADLYRQGFEAAGLETQRVVRPEIYQTQIAQNIFGLRHDDVHIAVKPIEHIRPFYGIKNIFIGGWEFPEFSQIPYENNPLFNQIAILKHADQVWCWSDFTTNNLRAHGIHTAITMPPPVIIPKSADEKSISDLNTLALNTTRDPSISDVKTLGAVLYEYKDSVIFFSIFNPYDYRKQAPLMLKAFKLALNKNPNMILIIKLVIDNIDVTLGTIQKILKIQYGIEDQCDRIIFIGDTLSDNQMIRLMQSVNYYLCTSSTEGLNLPLIEAMSQGVVPVSSISTAMADYISEENSIVLESERAITNGMYHFLHSHLTTTHFPPILSSLVDALISASLLSNEDYHSLSERAKNDVNAKYSVSAFVNKLSAFGGI